MGKDKTREVSYSIFELKRQQTEYVGLYTIGSDTRKIETIGKRRYIQWNRR